MASRPEALISSDIIFAFLEAGSPVAEFFGNDVQHDTIEILENHTDLRVDLVAGILAYKITLLTICEHFLINAGWDNAEGAEAIAQDFHMLDTEACLHPALYPVSQR